MVQVEIPETAGVAGTGARSGRAAKYVARSAVMFDRAGRLMSLKQTARQADVDQWIDHGFELSWINGQLLGITEWAWGVPNASLQFAPRDLEDLPWTPGSMERWGYGLLTSHEAARTATGEPGAWAVINPSAAVLRAGAMFPPSPRQEWVGTASPAEEYRLAAPNASSSRFLDVEGGTPYLRHCDPDCPSCSPSKESGPWIASGGVRSGADGRVEESKCSYQLMCSPYGSVNHLVWERLGGDYEPLSLDAWIAEQREGTSLERDSRRACFNLSVPGQVSQQQALRWLSPHLLGRGLDEYLEPALEEPTPLRAWEACFTAPASRDGITWRSSELHFRPSSQTDTPVRACVPLIVNSPGAGRADQVNEGVKQAVREIFSGSDESTLITSTGVSRHAVSADLLGKVEFAGRGLWSLSLGVQNHFSSVTQRELSAEQTMKWGTRFDQVRRSVWDVSVGDPVSFEDAFASSLRGKSLLAHARRMRPEAFHALQGSCGRTWDIDESLRTPTFGLGGTDNAPTVFLGENFKNEVVEPMCDEEPEVTVNATCDWWVELPLKDLVQKLAEKSPLKRLL